LAWKLILITFQTSYTSFDEGIRKYGDRCHSSNRLVNFSRRSWPVMTVRVMLQKTARDDGDAAPWCPVMTVMLHRDDGDSAETCIYEHLSKINRHLCFYNLYVLDADYCILEGPPSRLQGTSCQCWGSRDCRGCKHRPRSLSNIKTKSLEIRAKKTPNVLDLKNMRPTYLTSKNCAHRLQKNTRRPRFAGHTKERSSRFLWERICCQNFEQKTFWASLRKFQQKSFSPPKIPALMPPTN